MGALDQTALVEALGKATNKANNANVLTRTQAKYLDTRARASKTQREMAELDEEIRQNEHSLEMLKELLDKQKSNRADLYADLRSDLRAMNQMEMDGVFIPDEVRQEDSHGHVS